VIVGFVDMGGIVDHYCFKLYFHNLILYSVRKMLLLSVKWAVF